MSQNPKTEVYISGMEFEDYFQKIYPFFFKRMNNKEDVKDACAVVMAKIASFENNPEKLAWAHIWKICKNELYDYYKKCGKLKENERRLNDDNDEWLENKDYSPAYQAEVNRLYENIDKHLSPVDAQNLKWVYFDGYSYAEIAQKTGKNEVVLRKSVSRSIQKLKILYQK